MFDPSTMQHLGDVRQREILEQSERDRAGVPLHSLRMRLGLALISIGHRLARAAPLQLSSPPIVSQ
jgi:hypothetical protein